MSKRLSATTLVAGVLGILCAPALAARDAEASSHGDDAARHQVVRTYAFDGVRIVQFNLPVLSHYSYAVVSQGAMLVVDPDRDVAAYRELAAGGNLTIRGVYLTHSHADFVAGHRELAEAVGCPVYQSHLSGAGYAIDAVQEGSTIKVGSAVLRILETPGHTPDGTCAALYESETAAAPRALLSGDTLFVGSVGRPDLLEGQMTAAALAGLSHDTWTKKLAALEDGVIVLPAHGAGSLCGAHLSDQPFSTIGQERVANPYLQHKSRGAYVAAVLEGLPEAPQYFKHNAALNRQGPPLVQWDAALPAEPVADGALSDPANTALVDLRGPGPYAAGHIAGALNIGLRGRLETWVGTMVPWDARLVLVGSAEELKEGMFRLHRIGYAASVLTMASWRKAGLPLRQTALLAPAELNARIQQAQAPVLVDVRLPAEWMGLRIGTVLNLPLNHLAELSRQLEPAQPVVTVCNSAYRSSMAVGVLEAKGFKDVATLAGGGEAWVEAGLPVYGTEAAAAGATVQVARRQVRLADRLSPQALHRLLMDLPGTFDLVDIRPASHFADYSLPGARSVEVAELLSNPAYLVGTGPLIVVDRDGSLSMQVAGILSQRTQRSVKALHGGLEAYWRHTELDAAVRAVPVGPAPPVGSQLPTLPRPAPTAPGPAAPPRTPQKKSAGC